MIKSVEFVLYGYAVPGLEDRVVREASYIKWYSSCLVSLPLQECTVQRLEGHGQSSPGPLRHDKLSMSGIDLFLSGE